MSLARMRGSSRRRTSAFTVVELLVVLTIVVILLVIAVPAFQNMIASSEDAMADASLGAALKSGRDAAVQGGAGNDAAVVFFFEPGARLRAVTCVKAATVRLPRSTRPGDPQRRSEYEVFTPAAGFASVQMPRGWMVRGATQGAGTSTWYANSIGANRFDAGASVNWVFPETAFYDNLTANAGASRSTFMIRFEGGTGLLKNTPSSEVIVIDPRPTNVDRDVRYASINPTATPWNQDLGRWARMVAGGRMDNQGQGRTTHLTPSDMEAILGRDSSDAVRARPVSVVALYDENKLAAAIGLRTDPDTRSIYMSIQNPENTPIGPRLVSTDAAVGPRINQWISGDTNFDGNPDGGGEPDYPEAKLFSIDRFTGALKPLTVQRPPQ